MAENPERTYEFGSFRLEVLRHSVAASRKVYDLLGQEGALNLETPLDFNRFTRQRQEQVFDWIAQLR